MPRVGSDNQSLQSASADPNPKASKQAKIDGSGGGGHVPAPTGAAVKKAFDDYIAGFNAGLPDCLPLNADVCRGLAARRGGPRDGVSVCQGRGKKYNHFFPPASRPIPTTRPPVRPAQVVTHCRRWEAGMGMWARRPSMLRFRRVVRYRVSGRAGRGVGQQKVRCLTSCPLTAVMSGRAGRGVGQQKVRCLT